MNEWCPTFQFQSDIANLVVLFMYSTYFTYSPFDRIYSCLILLNLEEAVVGADWEVVRLRDVVHQGPEVLDSVKGGNLQNKTK